jgi:hypothetical protein
MGWEECQDGDMVEAEEFSGGGYAAAAVTIAAATTAATSTAPAGQLKGLLKGGTRDEMPGRTEKEAGQRPGP